MGEDIGERFYRETRYERQGVSAFHHPIRPPRPFKTYPEAERIALTRPAPGSMSLDEALRLRRSVRAYDRRPIAESDLAYLLWAATGVQHSRMEFRSAPSAGALYPIETYVAVNRVDAIAPGIYHYAVREHSLERIRSGAGDLAPAALGQTMCTEAAAVFIWTAIFDRARAKYRERAYRYIYMEAGHIAQNLALACVSRGLGSCQVAAFYDGEVEAVIGVDGGEEGVLYMSTVGYPA